MITVALPTWKNKPILWLPLEGLARQKCDVPWELVVMECETDSKELIESYKEKLEKAGCQNLVYIHSAYRMPLAIKWKMMAEAASGKVFCLQASDDYPKPTRNQMAWDGLKESDWFHSRYFYHYSFKHNRLIKYDKETYTNNWKTGFNISLHTDSVRNIADTQQPRGIDFYLFNQTAPERIYYDESSPRGGVATDGYNTLSTKRERFFTNPCPPYLKTNKTIANIGLPKTIVEQIQKLIMPEEMGPVNKKLTGKRIAVVFDKNFKGRRAGCEYFVDEGIVEYLKYRGVIKGNGVKTKTVKL